MKALSKTKLLNLKFDNLTMSQALDSAVALLKKKSKSTIFFLNADCLYKSQHDEEYKIILNNSSLLLSDGIGLKFATKAYGIKLKDNCNGTDFSPLYMQKLAKEKKSIFLLGGHEGVPEQVKENLEKQIPGIKIVGYHHGFFKDDKKVVQKINASRADVVFVALGVPLQEKFISHNLDQLTPKVYLGVGSLFNFLSGRIKRAPKFIRVLKLEWFWRFLMEPQRMFKRYFIDTFKLLFIILKDKLR